jgi:hypothetical protein
MNKALNINRPTPAFNIPPLGVNKECHALWKFAWTLTADSDKLQQRTNLLKTFFVPLQQLLNEAFTKLCRDHPDLPKLGCGSVGIGGSLANDVALDESDLDIVVRLNIEDSVQCVDDKWFWDEENEIYPSHFLVIDETIRKCVRSFEKQNSSRLGFKLVSEHPSKSRFTFVTTGNVSLEFDILFSLHGAGFWGILTKNGAIRSDNEISAFRLASESSRFRGFREMIRVLKFTGYHNRKSNPDFTLPSCTFDSAAFKFISQIPPKTWEKTPFISIFQGCLQIIRDAVYGKLILTPLNDPDTDLMISFVMGSAKRVALENFLTQWLSVPQEELLFLLKKATDPIDLNLQFGKHSSISSSIGASHHASSSSSQSYASTSASSSLKPSSGVNPNPTTVHTTTPAAHIASSSAPVPTLTHTTHNAQHSNNLFTHGTFNSSTINFVQPPQPQSMNYGDSQH